MSVTPFKEAVFQRLPTTDEELWWTVYALWGIKLPRTRVCPNHQAPFDAFADAYFARSSVSVWKASRGFGGKSMQLALLGLCEAAFLGAGVSILGGSGAQSQNVHNATDIAWSSPNAPKGTLEKSTAYLTSTTNGGWIKSLMASQTSVRGPHPARLRLDEIDEMDLAILEAAQGQPMRDRKRRIETQTVMSSTHQHPDGTMTAILKRAKEMGWSVYEWCWKETSNLTDGWLEADEIARKRTEVPAAMWQTEYDLQEPSFEGRAITTADVDRTFDPSLGTWKGDLGEMCRLEMPIEGSVYVTAVDWAKERDWTTIATFRTESRPWVCVAWRRVGRMSWPSIVMFAERQHAEYGGKFIHDATGLGNVVSDYLTMPRKLVTDQTLNGKERAEIFMDYIAAIENGEFQYPRIEYAYDEHRYTTLEDLFGRGHPPDSFVTGALAWATRRRNKGHAMVPPTGITRGASPWRMN